MSGKLLHLSEPAQEADLAFQVISSVRLRDVQPVSQGQSPSIQSDVTQAKVLHPSRRVTFDPASSIISFISDRVETCVDEFLEEWEKIQKVASLVPEGKWQV